ncbi:AMP-binding protein, partial [Burkholderia sp. E168m23]
MAIIDFYDRGWRLNPDGIAYIQGDRNYTFQEIGELSCRIANGLLAAGFAKEAKAAVWADNDVIGWSCALGMWRAGLAYIPVNGRNAVAENQYVLDAFD